MRVALWSFCVVLVAICGPNVAAGQETPRPPNVILIYTDDQGSVDVHCYGATDLVTPHMDALAGEGLRFTQFYAAAPVCSPSRAALLTGRYPQRAGVAGNVSSQPGAAGMPTEQVTMAEMFRAAGYATAHVGKWHLGYDTPTMPNAQGFDLSFGHMGGCIDNYSHFFYWNGPNRHDLWRNGQAVFADGRYFPQMMVEEAAAFMREHRQQPFFMYWAINLPHYPLQGTERWRAVYEDLEAPRRMYAAFVSTMDEMIGQLLEQVDELGLRNETIVVLQSDHGHSTEERTFGGGGSAGPYRGAKFSLFEGGIRVPAMIRWPGHLPAGETRSQMATAVDWYPTLAELCELPQPPHRVDGHSLVEVLRSGTATAPRDIFHWQSGRGSDGKPQWAVRAGDWKLIAHPNDTSRQAPLDPGDARFLVRLDLDPGETTNLAARHPDQVRRLEALHERWLRDVKQP